MVWQLYQSSCAWRVTAAIKRGDIPPIKGQQCAHGECRDEAIVYDHRDYTKPLEVTPVCRSCNALLGAAKLDLDAVRQHLMSDPDFPLIEGGN